MSYGLNNIIKKILPKRLFYRSLIIVATPIIVLQIVITVVFFDSLWIKANKGMTRSLVGEVKTLLDVYEKDKNNRQMILDLYNKNFNFAITLKENELLPEKIYIGKTLINLKKSSIEVSNKVKKINPQEKKILEKMLRSPGKVFSRNDIG